MVIDTNIIIACLSAEPRATFALSEWKRDGRVLFVSSITVAETLALPALTSAELARVQAFLRNFISVPFDDPIASAAAYLRRSYGLEIPDAAIAATALTRNVPLVTRDRQFRHISEISVLTI